MFEIDRSYIDPINLESLQGHIWDIRTDYKDDPTLPRIENYHISEEEFETYLEKKQNFEDFKDNWHRRQLLIYGVLFCLPLVYFSIFRRGDYLGGYLSGLCLCLLAFMGYSVKKAFCGRHFRNNPCETFIKALLSWEEFHQQRTR